jgi:hypothetical protein
VALPPPTNKQGTNKHEGPGEDLNAAGVGVQIGLLKADPSNESYQTTMELLREHFSD